MENNYLNFKSESEKVKPIFRIVSTERLFELFRRKRNVLVRPKKWEDPYENFIMNSTGELENGEMFSFEFRDNFYGQCWTKTRESDALWRIYSPNNNGVRITSSPKKLLKSLSNSVEESNLTCYIGRVEYYRTPKLESLLKSKGPEWINDVSGKGQAKTLLFKRNAFRYEDEIRLIYNSKGSISTDYYTYSIDPFELIDDIVFDPRMKYKVYATFRDKLKDIGFSKRIVKSKLYITPQLNLRV